jgi:mitochondrial fusion and transport protein UGO1
MSDSEVEHGPEAYFADPDSTPRMSVDSQVPEPETADQSWPLQEDPSRPEYIIPIGPAEGVWGMMKRMGGFRGEGWLGLWKGKALSLLQARRR